MAGSERDDDDESVLDITEQLNRPGDTAFNQQRIQSWQPILDPVWVIVGLFYMGIIMVPVGFKIDSIQKDVVEEKVTYDGYNLPLTEMTRECRIGTKYNARKDCFVNFTAPNDMEPPILIHYQLTNFHQNHRSYYTSRDTNQLFGQVGDQSRVDREACAPLDRLPQRGDDGVERLITLHPCGLIANTFFNDIFTLVSGNDMDGEKLEMIEDGIAWTTDLDWIYRLPDGFRSAPCPACDETCCESSEWSCKNYTVAKNGTCFSYHYPEDDTTQYLHETYPDIISPLEGVRNEHFVVWMRIATQPDFRKLYGWIDQPIAAGEVLTFRINNNYVVERFRGSKSLIVSTTSIFGGRNDYLAPVFVGVGIFCLVAGTLFALKHAIRPRKLGDPSYLHYKEH